MKALTPMPLDNQPNAVVRLFSGVTGEGGYDRKELPTGRVQLLFKGAQIGGWADDRNGPHWYVIENKRTVALHPSYRPILQHFGFERVDQSGAAILLARPRRRWNVGVQESHRRNHRNRLGCVVALRRGRALLKLSPRMGGIATKGNRSAVPVRRAPL